MGRDQLPEHGPELQRVEELHQRDAGDEHREHQRRQEQGHDRLLAAEGGVVEPDRGHRPENDGADGGERRQLQAEHEAVDELSVLQRLPEPPPREADRREGQIGHGRERHDDGDQYGREHEEQDGADHHGEKDRSGTHAHDPPAHARSLRSTIRL